MSERIDIDLLSDIKEAIRRINNYIENLTYEKFEEDIKTQDAVVRNLEIIGEATKNISKELKNKYRQIPWKSLAGVRDKLIHHYFGVNLDIVWNISKEEIPAIYEKIEEAFQSIKTLENQNT